MFTSTPHVDDVSRMQFTTARPILKADEHVRQRAEYPPAIFKGVVRSNFDTLIPFPG